jgi:uncharacterized phage infection (PIP) family protein YhgE
MKKLFLFLLPILLISCNKENRMEKIISSRLSQECTEYKAIQTNIKDTLTADEVRKWVDATKIILDSLNSSKLRIETNLTSMESDLAQMHQDIEKAKYPSLRSMQEATANDLQFAITSSKITISQLNSTADSLNIIMQSLNKSVEEAQSNIVYFLVDHQFECNGVKELRTFKFSEKLVILEK